MMTQNALSRILADFPWLWQIHDEWDPSRTYVGVEEADDSESGNLDLFTELTFDPLIEPTWVHIMHGCVEKVLPGKVNGNTRMAFNEAIINAVPMGAVLCHVATKHTPPQEHRSRWTKNPLLCNTGICVYRPPKNPDTGRRCFFDFFARENCFDPEEMKERKRKIVRAVSCRDKEMGEPVQHIALYAFYCDSCVFTLVTSHCTGDLEIYTKIAKAISAQEGIDFSNTYWRALETSRSNPALKIQDVNLYSLTSLGRKIRYCDQIDYFVEESRAAFEGLIP